MRSKDGSALRRLSAAVALSGCLLVGAKCLAQESDQDTNAQANNPLANLTAFNIQHYYIGDFTAPDDESGNQFFLRYAKPFQLGSTNWLFRGTLPAFGLPTGRGGDTEHGLGDVNAFAAYLFDTGNPAVSFGVGPQLTMPTATDDTLGSEKWSAGVANVLFDGRSKKFQYGYLLTWQHSFAGEGARRHVNFGAFQPFAFYQLGGGTYLRAAPIWTLNLRNGDHSVPVGVGVGQVIKQGKTVFNVFVEPQFSVADEGPLQPEWQVYAALNMQFFD